jgi:hypothetical protein
MKSTTRDILHFAMAMVGLLFLAIGGLGLIAAEEPGITGAVRDARYVLSAFFIFTGVAGCVPFVTFRR